MLKQRIVNSPRFCQRLCGPFEIDRIPEPNCSDDEIEPTGAVALVFKGTVSDFPQAVRGPTIIGTKTYAKPQPPKEVLPVRQQREEDGALLSESNR